MLSLLFAYLICAGFAGHTHAQSVFAHVIVGNTYSYTLADWAHEIEVAANASIDGFALNIGYLDTINPAGFVQAQLNNAYTAADATNFKLFFSFDYAAQGAWDQNAVIKTINAYSSRPSQFKWEGKPLASTFEGPNNAGDWAYIKSQTNSFFAPDFSSQGCFGAAAKPNVDGLLSWNAWPAGANDMTDGDDQAHIKALGGRPFIMPVSPWFYTNLPQWSKNWLWRGDSLWHQRWEQVAQLQPSFVEILTWNDWSESHYVGPLPPMDSAIPTGAERYVKPNPHDAWLKDLPHYIARYQNETRPAESHVTFWYRLNPARSGSAGGTTCNNPAYQTPLAPQDCVADAVFFTAFVPDTAIATVKVTIGGTTQSVTASQPGIFHSSVPFGQIGNGTVSVSVSASDGTKIGPVGGAPITSNCAGGTVNWNAWVGGS
ncbi:Glucan endo-1,3-alpha-glucosidase agn1 [Cladophialophora chaetospira]|uniref:Glucan endo-1,3-alpha-glucosidase agn1 n=1 Tax=Cladophialophora chaetospira TaxID=386627 RepID=A0AA38XP13_9EURO|nr:Glucan endo-1,3-alpha-glucosidase agn1 [Cladophialophora chaetospira]